MKNVDDLIEGASELAAQGFSKGEISDELNVSRETASWLVDRGGNRTAGDRDSAETATTSGTTGLADIHVDWSALGRDSTRLSHVGSALADLLASSDPDRGAEDIDLVIGIEKAGTPLATTVAIEIGADLGTYAPRKHQWEEGDIAEQEGGGFSRNFADIRGRECYVIDDTVTSGTTLSETIEAIESEGGTPVAGAVLVDKQGLGELSGVPIHSLLQVLRVGREDG